MAPDPYPDGEMVVFSGHALEGVAGAGEHGGDEADVSANPGARRRVRRVEQQFCRVRGELRRGLPPARVAVHQAQCRFEGGLGRFVRVKRALAGHSDESARDEEDRVAGEPADVDGLQTGDHASADRSALCDLLFSHGGSSCLRWRIMAAATGSAGTARMNRSSSMRRR